MKVYLAMLLFAFGLNVHAQTKFDLLRFEIPAGWQTTQTTPEYRMEKTNGKQTTCQIILYASKAGKITDLPDFTKSWEILNLGQGRAFPANTAKELQQVENWMQFTASAKNQNAGKIEWLQYTTLSNGKQYINMLIVVTDKAGMADIDNFYNTLSVDEGSKTAETAVRAKKKVVKFKPGKALKEEVGG